MRTRYEAMVDGIPLSSVDPAILIADIQETEPDVRRQTANFPTGDGQRVLRTVRQSLRVTVLFEIHTQDVRRRADICERVVRWAQGRFLAVNYRPEQRLRVICETPPAVTSTLSWTQRLKVVFAAYAVPFWEDARSTRLTVMRDAWASCHIGGTAKETLVEATVQNTGGAPVTSLTVAAGTAADTLTTLSFYGVIIPAGGSLVIAYDDARVLSATVAGGSVLSKRTQTSSDDLVVPCGARSIFGCSADGAIKTTFSFRGWYL